MTQLLKKYYEVKAHYRTLAEQEGCFNEQRNKDFNKEIRSLLEQMNEQEIKYLQNKSQGFSRNQYEPYLKKFKNARNQSSQNEICATTTIKVKVEPSSYFDRFFSFDCNASYASGLKREAR